VDVVDFGNSSWRDGLAICAILHHYYHRGAGRSSASGGTGFPHEFHLLKRTEAALNWQRAQELAQSHWRIPSLMSADAADDEQQQQQALSFEPSTLVAYLSSLYHVLEKGGSLGEKSDAQQAKGIHCGYFLFFHSSPS
jgi:hypothetical protein